MTNSTRSVQSAYNQWATVYDSDNNPTRDLNAKVLRKQNFNLIGRSVLEIGCGTGLNTIWLADRAQNFDLIVVNLVLEHLENLSHIFQEAHRVLRSGGQLYIGELHPYRQLQGSQAQYKDSQTGEEILVLAFNHSVSEFINEGISAGFVLRRIDEWKQPTDEIPRLLTLLFDRP
jgi:ubiquinone/menaquinone biosynthesis C-methylase UbiE